MVHEHAEPLLRELESALRAVDLRGSVMRAFRVSGAALSIEKRVEIQDAMIPPATLQRLRRARPFVPSLIAGERAPLQEALVQRIGDLEILEAVLDRCGIDAPYRSADLWPRGWESRVNRHLPGRGWLQHYRAGPPHGDFKSVPDRSGTARKVVTGLDGEVNIVFFYALALTGAAGESNLKLVTLPVELPRDRAPIPMRVVLDVVDLPRSAIWIGINDKDALPLCRLPGYQASEKDTQREHTRILPPSLLRRGRNDITIEVRAFPGMSDRTPAYINGVLFAWPK